MSHQGLATCIFNHNSFISSLFNTIIRKLSLLL
jgi:hypothetical protein